MLCLTMSFFLSFLSVLRAPPALNGPDHPWGHTLPTAQGPISAQPGALSPCPRDAVGLLVFIFFSVCLLDRPLFCTVGSLSPGWTTFNVCCSLFSALPLPPSPFISDGSLGGPWPPLANIIDRGDQNQGKMKWFVFSKSLGDAIFTAFLRKCL